MPAIQHLPVRLRHCVDVVIDCGASDGVWTREARTYFPHAQLFLGVEPHRYPKRAGGVRWVEEVISSSCGPTRFHTGDEPHQASTVYGLDGPQVTAHTLECMLKRQGVGGDAKLFVKTDLQGADIVALESLGPFLENMVAGQVELQIRPIGGAFDDLLTSMTRLSELGLRVVQVFDLISAPTDGLGGQLDALILPTTDPLCEAAQW